LLNQAEHDFALARISVTRATKGRLRDATTPDHQNRKVNQTPKQVSQAWSQATDELAHTITIVAEPDLQMGQPGDANANYPGVAYV
jgi:hypothetical protein